MRNYDRINALPPEGINEKRAHIIGGGIAGLAAAAFLVDDAHMPGANVTVYDAAGTTGGAMDSAGEARNRVQAPGPPRAPCLARVPLVPVRQGALDSYPRATVLEETYERQRARAHPFELSLDGASRGAA